MWFLCLHLRVLGVAVEMEMEMEMEMEILVRQLQCSRGTNGLGAAMPAYLANNPCLLGVFDGRNLGPEASKVRGSSAQ